MIRFCFLLLLLVIIINGQKLLLLSAIHRHGERTPIVFYPTDPHANDYWPRGLGQLTNEGKRQTFELGQYFRRTYEDFIGERFFANTTYYRSTDVDRTLMSAQLVCAGLFPPHEKDKWSNNLLWQPVPIHTVKEVNDYVLSRESDCPKFFQLHKEALKVPPISDLVHKYQPLFKSLTKILNFTVNFENVWEIYDDVSKELLRNMTERESLMGFWNEIVNLNNQDFGLVVPSREIQRLKAGPFIKEVIEHCQGKINNTVIQRLFLYSAHDTTLATMLDTLSVYNGLQPPYASAIIIEFYDLGEGGTSYENYAIKFLYRNSSTFEPYPLLVPGCDSILCKFDQFIGVVRDLIPEDIITECERPNTTPISSYPIVTFVAACFIAFLIVVSCTLFVISSYRKKHSVNFQPLLNQDLD